MSAPRVVIGVPAFNGEEHIRESLESLLGQRFADLRVLVVDDASDDRTVEIVKEYTELDDRVEYLRNKRQRGMVENWRRAFEIARHRYGGFEFYAWGSDHDLWHPRWAASLVRALDEQPAAVLAYPLQLGFGTPRSATKPPRRFETRGIENRWERLAATVNGMAAGSMVYGLYRAETLERCGVYREVMLPDRLLLSQLSLHGTFVQVPEPLWYRRFTTGVKPSYARQRVSFFPGGAPAYSYLPWWAMHTAWLWRSLVRGAGRPAGMRRVTGARAVLRYLRLSLSYALRRGGRVLVKAARRKSRTARQTARRAAGRVATAPGVARLPARVARRWST